MIDLSALPVPDGCPFIDNRRVELRMGYGYSLALATQCRPSRFIICATMTAWLNHEIECQVDNDASDEYLDQLTDMLYKWQLAQAEAYAAIKESPHASN